MQGNAKAGLREEEYFVEEYGLCLAGFPFSCACLGLL